MLDLDNLGFSQMMQDEGDFIPLISTDDEVEFRAASMPKELPILPLRNTVIFPGVIAPITAGRDKSIRLIQDSNTGERLIGVISQKNQKEENPNENDLYQVGTVAKILKLFKMPDGNITVIIQGKSRFEVNAFTSTEPYLKAQVTLMPEKKPTKNIKKFEGLVSTIKDLALQIIEESPNIPTEAQIALRNIESDVFLLNFITSNMNLDVTAKQKVLEESNLMVRAEDVLRHLNSEMQMLTVKNEIQSKVRNEFDQQQREYFLQQQMRTIQEELGGNSYEAEIQEMRIRAKKKKWNQETEEAFEKEITKLQRLNPQIPEFSVQRNYLELMLDLPWEQYSKDRFDLSRAQRILDRDHSGLEKVKERIMEYLAVLKLKGDMKSPILCLYGPPGVGKTSLGKSVAEALGRKYVRMSLGGLRDEAEIRGHRKTYIGAMPGRILQNIKKAGTSNPVFVLDEIDKLVYDGHGDPSSALLEVLDPEQNNNFNDNFLELGYDLSRVLFVATANNLASIQPALRDRMEIIEVNGYTIEEKVEIAKKHLFPKQVKEHGLEKGFLKIAPRVIERIVEGYTRESGVRSLEKTLAKVVRNVAKRIAAEEPFDTKITPEAVHTYLGPPRFDANRYETGEHAGVVTGLAWTPVGGDILFIESLLSRGSGKLSITGNLGDVMKESATIAMVYLKSNYERLGIPFHLFKNWDVHIHVPEGATPKDGPSAGITILTALASLFTQRKVRPYLAMTGEITLRGKVLPVGGIKEKILAAKRANIKHVILCEQNRKDIEEIKADYLQGLQFKYVTTMQEVLDFSLLQEQVPNPRVFEPDVPSAQVVPLTVD
jgi:ATP-dependent Lon protease